MKPFSRTRLLRALAVWTTIAILLTVLTLRERSRIEGTATTPTLDVQKAPLDERTPAAFLEEAGNLVLGLLRRLDSQL